MILRIGNNSGSGPVKDDGMNRRCNWCTCCTSSRCAQLQVTTVVRLSWPSSTSTRSTTSRHHPGPTNNRRVNFRWLSFLVVATLLLLLKTEAAAASAAALDMVRGFDDFPLRGADSSRQRQQKRALQQFRRQTSTARSSWRMLHRAPAEMLSHYPSRSSRRRGGVSPANAAPPSSLNLPLSLNDLLLGSGAAGWRGGAGGGGHHHRPRLPQRHYTTAQLVSSSKSPALKTENAQPIDENGDYNYDELTWLGRFIAAGVEIGFTVVLEYASGFVGGYFLGSLTDIPRFVRQSAATAPHEQLSLWREFAGRTARMNTKALQWGRSWGGITAAFGGFDVTVRILRNGKRDEWNTILSSVAAGAWFARKDGPQAMLRGAVLYGGLMYLLSGNVLGGARRRPFEYEEQTVEF